MTAQEYEIRVGNDGKHYAVFKDAYAAEISDHAFRRLTMRIMDT